ncbi:MaoC/PaaZ C-terminal domain-containing protein [Mesorhizobium sp.]|uniref:MaoC/PaaZ C-terminal domain-containing protein n=1 Tax=Mesorhizobium sp. TaxID=1871066 RepID=UPI000FE9A083|nr:MaoC/PaaZ C-terminal domain-containing protein [Mesorhizobium sp.]RWI88913.1 MAG: hypothetical protein EOR21_26350 [Mesorhizobium sp.]
MDSGTVDFVQLRNFIIGDVTGPAEVVLDEHRVRSFIYAVDDFNPWYISASPFGGPISPVPLFTSDDPDFAKLLKEETIEDALASRFEIGSLAPIPIGERVLLSTRNVDKYFRRDKEYRTREFEIRAAVDDRVLLRSRLTEMVAKHPAGSVPDTPGRAASGPLVLARAAIRAPVARAAHGLAAETPVPPLTKSIRRKQMFVFSAREGWWTSIHTDPNFARSLGFPTAIAQALMSTGYISQLCTEFFGASWFTSGKASLAFLRPVCMGDELTVEGRVTGYEADKGSSERLLLDVWCVNQHGELTAAGTASALVEETRPNSTRSEDGLLSVGARG